MIKHPLRDLVLTEENLSLAEVKQNLAKRLQEICLLGLWRAGFFEYAAFYGGTALSLIYNLDRFSEDLDFSLLKPNLEFDFKRFSEEIKKEFSSWRVNVEVDSISKQASTINSAFVKTNTYQTLMSLSLSDGLLDSLHRNEVTKVKFELDPNPPCFFKSGFRPVINPIPFNIRVMTLEDMFAGKLHALLARKWKSRTKGRDWYDLIWFIRKRIRPSLDHLEARLKQSGNLRATETLTPDLFADLLSVRISKIDFEQAKRDVQPFLRDPRQLENWSKEFFLSLIDSIDLSSAWQ